jgi:hypothetical protein
MHSPTLYIRLRARVLALLDLVVTKSGVSDSG